MIPSEPTTDMTATPTALTMHSLQAATLAARQRTGDTGIGVGVAGGRFKITRTTTDPKGRMKTEDVSDWLDGRDLIPALNNLKPQD